MVGDSNIVTLDINGAILELICNPSSPLTPPAGAWSHLAIHFQEFDEALAKLGEMGIETRLMTMESGDRLCFFNDLDGHTIEVAAIGL